LLVTRRRRRSRTTISIFGGIGTEEAISASTAGAKPAAIGRVGEAEKAKYNLESCSYKAERSRNRPIPKYCVLYGGGPKAKRSASESRGA
jgi:hypothetical protein